MKVVGFLFISFYLLPSLALCEESKGKEVYNTTCVVCHGADGEGAIPGVPDFTTKDGPLKTKSDELLVKHMLEGFQSKGSSMAMPPKGGNVDLTEEDLKAVLQFMKTEFK